MNITELRVIVPAKKQPSTKDYIVGLEINEEINAPYEKRTSIAPLISNIKLQYTGRDYKTTKVSITKGKKTVHYLNIKRTA